MSTIEKMLRNYLKIQFKIVKKTNKKKKTSGFAFFRN